MKFIDKKHEHINMLINDDLFHAEQLLNELFSVETEEDFFKKIEEKKSYYQKKNINWRTIRL